MSDCTKCENRGARNYRCILKINQVMTADALFSSDSLKNKIKCKSYRIGPQSKIYIPLQPHYRNDSQ